MKTARGTARALRRASAAPSLHIAAMRPEHEVEEELDQLYRERRRQYSEFLEEGYSRYQARLMAGLGDPHE